MPGSGAVQLTFWVNSQEVATYTDGGAPFSTGYIGVFAYAGARPNGHVRAEFEEFGARSVARS
jgi:hypothetical protein